MLQPVVLDAWRGKSSPVDPNQAHEACHVARFVHGAPAGIVAAIKQLPGVSKAVVHGVFCHKKPLVFWDDPLDKDNLSRRELADLMIEVRVNSSRGTAKRAMLVQVKMDSRPITRGVTTLSGLDPGQRRLYADLPPFCLEIARYGVEKCDLVKQGVRTIVPPNGFTLSPFALAQTLLGGQGAGFVYVAVDRNNLTNSAATTPWLAEDGFSPRPASTTGTFNVDFAWALAEMIAEAQPTFGIRSDNSVPVRAWFRLIDDLKRYAAGRKTAKVWKGQKALDIVLRTKPTRRVLNNVARFATLDGRVTDIWSRASTEIHSRFRGGLHYMPTPDCDLLDFTLGEGEFIPPVWSQLVKEGPFHGTGMLSINVNIEDWPDGKA